MKLLSLNVALFEKNNQQVSDFIQDQNPDIVCLQEVTKAVDDKTNPAYVSINSIKAATQTFKYSFFSPTWVVSKFEKANFHGHDLFQFDLGGKVEFGQYIASKLPIHTAQNIFVQNHFSYVTDWSNWPDEDYRAVQVSDIQLENTMLRILNYHGIWSKNKQGNTRTHSACKEINKLALEVTYPSIICGDFNLFPDTESMNVFNKHTNLVNKYRIKSTRPVSNELNTMTRNVVDYMLVSEGITVTDFKVEEANVSDHLPLIMNFEIEPRL